MNALINIELTADHQLALLSAAFEGGSGYWITKFKITKDATTVDSEGDWGILEWTPVYGGEILIFDDEGQGHTLSQKELAVGAAVMAAGYRHHLADALDENEDAITGDVYLQCCLFGEVVYS